MESLQEITKKTITGFSNNAESVKRLMTFDQTVTEYVISALDSLIVQLRPQEYTAQSVKLVENALMVVKNVRKNDSTKVYYDSILNSCLVLLVSYFSSAVSEIFKTCLNSVIYLNGYTLLDEEDFKMSFRDIKEIDFNITEHVGDLVISKNDISFQDMQSIKRAFEKYFGINIIRDNTVNNLILAMSARHAIVHSGGVITDKTILQVRVAVPRDIKTELSIDQQFQFDDKELHIVISGMSQYLENIGNLLVQKWSTPHAST